MDNIARARQRDRFALPIRCIRCGQIGSVVWEENMGSSQPAGPERTLVRISSGFHTGDAETQSHDKQIVCDICDEIVPD